MRPFPHLQSEQDNLVELCAQYWSGLPPVAKAGHAAELCRLATAISQVREEVVQPWLVDWVEPEPFDRAIVELDLIRVLVHELMASRPREQLYDALVATLCQLIRRRFDAETGAHGEWSGLTPAACAEADTRAASRFRELDRASRQGDWAPLQPSGLETLRSSVPPGAAPWSSL